MARTKKVLIIEFDINEASQIAHVLRRSGFDVKLAKTGKSGLEIFKEEAPDLVAVNLIMPDMQGPELIGRIRDGDATVPIVVIDQTATSNPLLISRMGGTDHIAKPIQQGRFLKIVTDLLGAPPEASPEGPPTGPRTSEQMRIQGVPPRGSLRQLGFHHLISRIFRERKTGQLVVRAKDEEARVFFRDGLAVRVHVPGLARWLAREGHITREQAQEIRLSAGDSDVPEVETVRRANLLPPEQLRLAVTEYAYTALRDLCRHKAGRFAWRDQEVKGDELLDPALVLAAAAQRHFAPERIVAALENKGRMDKPFFLADDPERLPGVARNPILRATVDAARARRVLKEFLSQSRQPRAQLERMVYALSLLRMIAFDPRLEWRPGQTESTRLIGSDFDDVAASVAGDSSGDEADADFENADETTFSAEPASGSPAAVPRNDKRVRLADDELRGYGRQLLKDQTYSKALRCFDELLVRNRDDAEALLAYAIAASRNRFGDPVDQLFDAVDALRRHLAIDPNSIAARAELVRVLNDAGEPELAVRELEDLLKIDPENAPARKELRSLKRRLARQE